MHEVIQKYMNLEELDINELTQAYAIAQYEWEQAEIREDNETAAMYELMCGDLRVELAQATRYYNGPKIMDRDVAKHAVNLLSELFGSKD